MRVRGLKLKCVALTIIFPFVAPRAGAWIEIPIDTSSSSSSAVAPRAGAWIEITEQAAAWEKFERRTPCGCVD